MKKKLLQTITTLSCFALNDKECIKLQSYLITEDYNSARIYLDKVIEINEWTFAFDEDNIDLKQQLKHCNEIMDLVIELTIIDEGDKRKGEQVRTIAE